MSAEIIEVDIEQHSTVAMRNVELRRGQVYFRMIEMLEDEYGVSSSIIYETYCKAMLEMDERMIGKNVVPFKKAK